MSSAAERTLQHDLGADSQLRDSGDAQILRPFENHGRIVCEYRRESLRHPQFQDAEDDAEGGAESGRDPAGTFGAGYLSCSEILSYDRSCCGAESDADHVQPALDAVADPERGQRRSAELSR